MDTEVRLHAQRVAEASALLGAGCPAPLALAKPTSNLFRDRRSEPRHRIDLRAMNHVLQVEVDEGWVDTEGMTTYEQLVEATLLRGAMPAVVPQLKTITAGGAVAGVGIEATSFRHGLVHHTLRELEVLLPDGEVVVCTADNAHSDLFFGFPNSYGSLGYAVRLRLATQPVRPFVHVRHRRHPEAARFFEALAAACAADADFVDGVVFGPHEHVLSTAHFAATAGNPSDYTFEKIYYRSLLERGEDELTVAGYLWRWDTDWFWCSRTFGAQNPLLRRVLGRGRLNSRTYGRWMRLNARWQLTRRLAAWRGRYRESVIQDVDVPLPRAGEVPRIPAPRDRHSAGVGLPRAR